MKVFVIGGSGFVGRRIIGRLIADGHTTCGLARSETAATRLRELGAEPIAGDLDLHGTIGSAIASSTANTLITSVSFALGHGPRIVEAAERNGIARGVFISTTSIFTKLESASKPRRLEAEERIRASTIEWTIIRPTMIYGAPGDGNMSRLLTLLRRTSVVPLPGGGGGLLQPVHVEDVADAVVTALGLQAVGRAYEIAGPEAMPLRDVVREAAGALGRRVRTFPVPTRPVIACARIAERLRIGGLRAEQFERLAEDKAFDIAAARRDLGFNPRPFRTGITAEAALLGPPG